MSCFLISQRNMDRQQVFGPSVKTFNKLSLSFFPSHSLAICITHSLSHVFPPLSPFVKKNTTFVFASIRSRSLQNIFLYVLSLSPTTKSLTTTAYEGLQLCGAQQPKFTFFDVAPFSIWKWIRILFGEEKNKKREKINYQKRE